MSSPCSSALASRPPRFSSYFGFPGCYSLCLHKDAVGVADRLRNTPATQGPRHIPRARRCFDAAYPLLFFLFWLCGCYSLCLQKHALGLHTTQKGPKCPSNDGVRNAPSTRGPRHVPRAWHCFGKAYPLFSFYFGCAAAILRVQRDAPAGGGYDMSIAYGAADAPRMPGFSSYFALLRDEA